MQDQQDEGVISEWFRSLSPRTQRKVLVASALIIVLFTLLAACVFYRYGYAPAYYV